MTGSSPKTLVSEDATNRRARRCFINLILFLLEVPGSPEPGSELRFGGHIGNDGCGLVCPVNALGRLLSVAAEDADVSLDAHSCQRLETKQSERHRDLI